MRKRVARKICNQHYGPSPWKYRCQHKRSTIDTAFDIGRKRDTIGHRDYTFPYVPSEEEMDQQAEVTVGIFAGLAKSMGAELPDELNDLAFDFSDHH